MSVGAEGTSCALAVSAKVSLTARGGVDVDTRVPTPAVHNE